MNRTKTQYTFKHATCLNTFDFMFKIERNHHSAPVLFLLHPSPSIYASIFVIKIHVWYCSKQPVAMQTLREKSSNANCSINLQTEICPQPVAKNCTEISRPSHMNILMSQCIKHLRYISKFGVKSFGLQLHLLLFSSEKLKNCK